MQAPGEKRGKRGADANEALFEREAEYACMVKTAVDARKNLLVFGEARAGKTRLLRRFATKRPNTAYVAMGRSLRAMLAALADATAPRGTPPTPQSASPVGVKTLIEQRLKREPWILVLDQVEQPAANIVRLVKDLHAYGRTPLVFAGRSWHAEDIGGFRSFVLDRSLRLDLKPFPAQQALAFARMQAERMGLRAGNLDEVLAGMATQSAGYPGRILDLLQMAGQERYRSDSSVKFHTLYLDYLMKGTRA